MVHRLEKILESKPKRILSSLKECRACIPQDVVLSLSSYLPARAGTPRISDPGSTQPGDPKEPAVPAVLLVNDDAASEPGVDSTDAEAPAVEAIKPKVLHVLAFWGSERRGSAASASMLSQHVNWKLPQHVKWKRNPSVAYCKVERVLRGIMQMWEMKYSKEHGSHGLYMGSVKKGSFLVMVVPTPGIAQEPQPIGVGRVLVPPVIPSQTHGLTGCDCGSN